MSEREKELLSRLESPLLISTQEAMRQESQKLAQFRPWMDIGPDVKAQMEERILAIDRDIQQLESFKQELDGLFVWMREVEVFLNAEEAAFGDRETLEAQLKESDALQDDINTLKPNVTVIREAGLVIRARCDREKVKELVDDPLNKMEEQWNKTCDSAREQNRKLARCLEVSARVTAGLDEFKTFLKAVEGEVPKDEPVAKASEVSQRTHKLAQLKDRLEGKKRELEEMQSGVEEVKASCDSDNPTHEEFDKLIRRFGEVQENVIGRHASCKAAAAEYGEFKALSAQESDWLDRLEKKLKKGTRAHTAADAEEISEELDDIENLLNNHPEERLCRMAALARSLGGRRVLEAGAEAAGEAERLRERWLELAVRAKQRTDVLEGKELFSFVTWKCLSNYAVSLCSPGICT